MVLSKKATTWLVAGAVFLAAAITLGIFVSPWAWMIILVLPLEAFLVGLFAPKDKDADERSI